MAGKHQAKLKSKEKKAAWLDRLGSKRVLNNSILAEVSKMWIEEVQSKTGGYRVRQIQLSEGDKKFACSLSPGMDKLWYQLEVGKSYEVSISHSLNKCYVYAANEVDKSQVKRR